MADLGGDSASMMMGPFDPSAFAAGRDEDLFLPGDSLFGFSAAAGIGSNPDVGGGSGGGGGDASFQGGSASMLFPPATAASFQAMASLPPEPDSAAVSAAGVLTSCPTSSSRRDVGGGAGERAETECCAGNAEGDDKNPRASPPPLRTTTPSLKQSLAAAIGSAAARDAANEAAAAAAGGRNTATKPKKAALKPKSSARPRRRVSGGRGGRKSSTEAKASGGGGGADGGNIAGAGASATASEATPIRPTRNLRRPRQESNKQRGQATTTAAAPAAATASATAFPHSGDILGSPRRRVAANGKGGETVQQAKKSATSSATTATVAAGGRSVSRTNPTTRRQQSGGSPCRPPPRRTSLHAPPVEMRSSGADDTVIGLPVGMELIPGFEDTIDSHYMTALLQKGSDTQPDVPASAFASVEDHGLKADNGDRGGGGGGEDNFGGGPDASLGLAAPLLLGCDTQPSAAAATDAAADASQRHLSELAEQSVQKDVGGGASLDTDDGRLDMAWSSTAQFEAGDAPSLPAPAAPPAAPPVAATAVAASPLPPPVMELVGPVSPSTAAAVVAPSVPPSSEAPAAVGTKTVVAAASSDPAGELTAATDPGATNYDNRKKKPKRSATAPPRRTPKERTTKGKTKTSSAVAAAAAAAAAAAVAVAKPTVESQGESTTAPAATLPCVDCLNGPTQVETEAVAAQAGATVATTPVECAKEASRAPSLLAPPSSVAAPRGSLEHASAPVARVGVESGGFAPPAAPLRAAPAAEVASAPSPPPRPLPRKVSLRFAPRDASTESKLSEHGYLPFQKLTAPLYKPLEAVFKFMMKKWSGVAYSDLNSIRIVLDVAEADGSSGSDNAETQPSARRTIVWSAEHSSNPLADLVRSLPDPVLERICDEEALNLTYTFSTGPVGPPPSQGSLPWDMLQVPPAAATATAAPRPPPPPTEHQPIPRLGDISASSPLTLRSPAEVSTSLTAVGAEVVVPRPAGSAKDGSIAMVVAEGTAPPVLAASGLEEARNGSQSAVGVAAGGGAGGWPIAWKRRSTRGGGTPADIIANTALKRHYTIVKSMFKRQGITSPPVTHFLPGGLFARMHTAAVAGGIGAVVGAGAGAAAAGVASLPLYSPEPPVEPSYTTAGKASQVKKKNNPLAAGEPLASSEGGLDVGGDGGFEEFGSEATNEARGEGGGNEAGGSLMGEETCMALFSGNGVELLVDPSPLPTGTGEVVSASGGGGEFIAVGDAESAVQPLSPPLVGGIAASASATPEPAGGGEQGVAASSAPPGASKGAEANVDLSLPLTQPSLAVVAQSAVPPASPPQGDCALMGEETCMALFSGGNGVELLADPSLPPPETGEAAAAGEGGGGGEENHIDAGVAEPAAQPVSSLPTGGTAASASAAQFSSGEAGEQVESVRPPSQPDGQPESAPRTGGAAVDQGATTQPALAPMCGVDVAAVEALGMVGVEGNAEEKAGLALQVGTDAVPAVRLEGAPRVDMDAERATAQPTIEAAATVVEAKLSGEPRPKTPPRAADAPPASLGASTALPTPCAGVERAPLSVDKKMRPPSSSCSPLAETCAAEASSSRTSSAAVAPSAMPTEGGGARAVSGAPEDRAEVAPTVGGEVSEDEPPRGERDPGGEKVTVRAEVAPPVVEGSLQPLSSTPDVPARAKPRSSGLLSPPVFKIGTLPSRAKFGHPPSCAFASATASSAAATAESKPAKPSSAGPSKTPAQSSPPPPPSAEGQVAPSLSKGTASGPGKASSSTGGQQQSELEPVAAVSGVPTETCRRGASQATDKEAEAQARQVMLANGVASEAAVAFQGGGGGGGGGDGGGGGVAVSLTTPPSPPSVRRADGTAGVAGGAAEDALLSQALGRRKLTRSHSNGGGDPVTFTFGSSGGGRSSRPEEVCERAPKKARRDASRRVPGAPSASATPPQAPGVAGKSGAERRTRGSRKDAREGLEKKRVAPTTETSGGPPQRVATPVFDAPAVDVPAVDVPAVDAPAVDAPLAVTDAPTPAASAPRPFAFASAKKKEGVGAGGSGPPPPLPLAVGQGIDVAAVPTANPEPACLPPVKACGTTAVGVVGVAAAAAAMSPAVRTPVACPPPVKARPFAFAAAAKKGERGRLLRAGDPAAPAAATGQTATLPRRSGLPAPGVVENPSPHSKPPPGKSSEAAGATDGLASPPQPAAVRNSSVNASLSLSMSAEEVQAEYSEAWSSLPSCFWDESALVAGDAGGGGGGVTGEKLPAGGAVTRWLALPHAEPTLGGMAGAPTTTAPAAPAPAAAPTTTAPAAPAPAPAPAPAAAAAAAAAALSCGEDRGDGRRETEAGVGATVQPGAPPSAGLAQREVNHPSRWASFCTAFASSSRGSAGAATTTGATTSTAPTTTRGAEGVRSLPTLIRLGRSMTKGVAPVETKDDPEEEADTGVATAAAAAAAVAMGKENTGKEPRSAGAIAEAAGAPASAPARASSAAAAAGKPFGTSGTGAVPPAGAGGCKGGDDGVSNDRSASDTVSGGRRKRDDGGGGSGGDGDDDAGGERAAAAAVVVATALPKKRAKKKGRISPMFVSSLPPPDSFETLATTFSSNRRA